jgi:hypothetical protein
MSHHSGVAELLEEFVPTIEEEGDWEQVHRDASRSWPRRRLHVPRRRATRVSLAAAMVAVAAAIPLSALAVTQDWWFLGASEQAPVPTDAVIVVRSGNWDGVPWALTAYRSHAGLCVAFTPNPPTGQGVAIQPSSPAAMACTVSVRGISGLGGLAGVTARHISLIGGSSQLPNPYPTLSFIAGPTATDVASVTVTLADGSSLTTHTFPAPPQLGLPINFFVAQLPAHMSVRSVQPVGKNGQSMETVQVPPATAQSGTTQPGSEYGFTWGS